MPPRAGVCAPVRHKNAVRPPKRRAKQTALRQTPCIAYHKVRRITIPQSEKFTDSSRLSGKRAGKCAEKRPLVRGTPAAAYRLRAASQCAGRNRQRRAQDRFSKPQAATAPFGNPSRHRRHRSATGGHDIAQHPARQRYSTTSKYRAISRLSGGSDSDRRFLSAERNARICSSCASVISWSEKRASSAISVSACGICVP